jgi:glycosyltransferase involved in cell wall biosynthesis
MKLLIVTQVVDKNDPVLGFFHRWIEEFAKYAESIEVICLKKGDFNVPTNVRVHSLGKENGDKSRLRYSLRFLRLVWQLRRSYDNVFVHMNPEYIVLAGPFWRLWGKRIALWYMHKSVTASLRLGVLYAHDIFTASERSMRIRTPKKRVMGHGIPVELIPEVPPPLSSCPVSLVTIGRISKIKRIDLLIAALQNLRSGGIDAKLTIIGGPAGDSGAKHAEALTAKVGEYNLEQHVHFAGPVPHARISTFFEDAHLFVHASDTGSLDKAVLEPLAAGLPVITTDSELGSEGLSFVRMAEPTAEGIAVRITEAIRDRMWENEEIRRAARKYVGTHHSLTSLIKRVLAEMRGNVHG